MEQVVIKNFKYPLDAKIKMAVEKMLDENFGVASGRMQEEVEESKNTHYSNPVEYVLAFDGDALVGIQMLFLREVISENQKILIGGLGGLCVDKKYRGRGIAKKLLADAMVRLFELRCDIGMLFTNISDPRYVHLYGGFGFKVFGKMYTFINKLGNVHTGKYAMIAPLCSQEKFNLLFGSNEILNLGDGEW